MNNIRHDISGFKWVCKGKWVYHDSCSWITRQKDGQFLGVICMMPNNNLTKLWATKLEAAEWIISVLHL